MGENSCQSTNIESDTIVAIATPIGSGAIGIIRLSGSRAWDIVGGVFHPGKSAQGAPWSETGAPIRSHQLMHGFIIDGKQVVDEVLVAVMKAPKSYTREEVVEIQSHSGPAVMRKLLTMMLNAGARLAEPGEFTRRAFLNGRIDLSQAEAISDLINSRTDMAMGCAALQLTGELQDRVDAWSDTITNALVEIEARIEFGEDLGSEAESDPRSLTHPLTQDVIKPLKQLISEYDRGHVVRDGIRLNIIGRPNVGKSSLLNRLVKKERSIVTPIPGTTRDLIEDFISIRGIPIYLTDTAGLHSTKDPIETIGIKKTKELMAQANLIICMVDASNPFTSADDDALGSVGEKNTILVVNKIDLISPGSVIPIPEKWYELPLVHVSALTGEGIEELKDVIAEICLGQKDLIPGNTLIPSLRQKRLLEEAADALERGLDALHQGLGDDILANEFTEALEALKKIIGKSCDDLIIEEIFSRFCIGK
jgi:tRNA modification GTPase